MASDLGACVQGWGWQYDFYFGYGVDKIEEDAINEKCCLQVLRILTEQADAEIIELEDNLAILRCQLKWVECGKDEELYELWCHTFRNKIDALESSIHNLRNENMLREDGFSADLVLRREPVARIYYIISTFLQRDIPRDSEQFGEFPNVDAVTFNSDQTTSFKDNEQGHATDTCDDVPLTSVGQSLSPVVEKMSEITVKEESSLDASSCVTTYSIEEKCKVGVTRRVEINENIATSEGGSGFYLSPLDLDEDNDHPMKAAKDLGRDDNHGSASSQRGEKNKAIKRPMIAAISRRDSLGQSSNKLKIKIQSAYQGNCEPPVLHSLLDNFDGKNSDAVLKKVEPPSPDVSISGSDAIFEKQLVSSMLNSCELKLKRKHQPKVSGTQPSVSRHFKIHMNSQKAKRLLHGIGKETFYHYTSESKRLLCGTTKDWMSIKRPLDVASDLGSISKFAKGQRSKIIKLETKNPTISSCSLHHQEDAINSLTDKEPLIRNPSIEDSSVDASGGPFACKECCWCKSKSPCLQGMSLQELKGLAKKHNLRGYGKLKKNVLIELLSKNVACG